MPVDLKVLSQRAHSLLQVSRFQDYCPNGLQVEGENSVQKIVAGVTASQAFIDAAIAKGADAILVHHGFFWKNEDPCVKGLKRNRLKSLLQNDVSLLAYHLPLDAHEELGNNVRLARHLGLLDVEKSANKKSLLMTARLPNVLSVGAWAECLQERLGREPLLIGDMDKSVERIALCTGAAQDFFEEAIELGVDAFLTGEISEQSVHIARESGVVFASAGHHATERYGVQALAEQLAAEFQLDYEFIDIDNPV